jgi:pre-mRNA-splicing factor CDC5/CEF1
MTAVQTPLLGEENTPFHGREAAGTGFESATPRTAVASTPNPLATPARGGVLQTPRTVPGVGATPRSVRDGLHINDDYSTYGQTPQSEKSRQKAAKRALQAGFASLPKPENNFELAEDEEEEEEEGEEEVMLSEEDAAERDARLKAAREREEQLELARRSSVVKKGLPRPIAVDSIALLTDLNATIDEEDGVLADALRAINLEVALLMRHDSLAHPLPGSSVPGTASDYDMPEDEFVAEARKAIHSELAGSLGLPGANEEQVKTLLSGSVDDDSFATSWAKEKENLIFDPQQRAYVEISTLSSDALSAAYRAMIATSTERMVQEATRAAKAEKKLGKQLGGYQALNAKAKKGIIETMEEIQATQRDLETFLMLKQMEEAGAPARLEQKRQEVADLERRERDLQARYAEINDERRSLVERIQQVRVSFCERLWFW